VVQPEAVVDIAKPLRRVMPGAGADFERWLQPQLLKAQRFAGT